MIDRLFDTMNGHDPRAKGFKAPLGALNWMESKAFLSRASEYLLTLVTKDGTPLHRSKRPIKIVLVIHDMSSMILCSLMHRVPKMLRSLHQVHMMLLLQCFFFCFVSVQIVLYSVPHKCHNSMYANMMLFYFNVFQCSVLFVGIVLYVFQVLDVCKWYVLHNIKYM